MAKSPLTGEDIKQGLDKALASGTITAAQHKRSLSSLQGAGFSGADQGEQLKKQNKTLEKGLNAKTGDGLNSNVIKLFKEVKKNNELTKSQMKTIIEQNNNKREFKTIGQRVQGKIENVKDFFTLRGFLDKTGISKRGSGGMFSEYLDAREDRQKYAKAREAAGDPTSKLYGKSGANAIFQSQRKEQQNLTRDANKNQRKIDEYNRLGISQAVIDKSPESKALEAIAKKLAKVDPSLRPPGYNPTTGKISSIEQDHLLSPREKSGSKKNQDDNKFSEKDLEQDHYQDEQISLLTDIEENTRGDGKKSKKGSGGDGKGIFSGLMGGLGNAGASLIKFGIGMVAMAGALWIASKSFKSFGELDWTSIGKGLAVLAGLVATAVLLDKVKGSVIKGALVLGGLGLVLWGVSAAFKEFSSLDWETIGKGFAAIAGLGVIGAIAGTAAPLILTGALAIGAMGVALLPFAYAMNLAGPAMIDFATGLERLQNLDEKKLSKVGTALKTFNDFPWIRATAFVAAGGSMKMIDGSMVYNASKANADQKAANDASKATAGNNNIVNAPTTISKQSTNNLLKPVVRNEDSSLKSYYRSRFAS
jgi:hypothetical protein